MKCPQVQNFKLKCRIKIALNIQKGVRKIRKFRDWALQIMQFDHRVPNSLMNLKTQYPLIICKFRCRQPMLSVFSSVFSSCCLLFNTCISLRFEKVGIKHVTIHRWIVVTASHSTCKIPCIIYRMNKMNLIWKQCLKNEDPENKDMEQ